MGRQTGFLLYSGKLRGLVGYYRRNKKGKKEWWERKAPEHVRQTAATQRAATDFGTASKCSRVLRHALHPWLQHYSYHFDHNRLNKAFIDLVKADPNHKTGHKIPTHRNLQSLCGFNFNSQKNIRTLLTADPVISELHNTTIIQLPGINISNTKANKGITHLNIKAIALPLNFAENSATPPATAGITVNRNETDQPVTLTLPANKAQTLIILEIQCCKEMNDYITAQNSAMAIIAVLPAAKTQKSNKTYQNKPPQLNIIPPYYTQLRKRKQSISLRE